MSHEPLFQWMEERERMRQLRVAGMPPPWTSDPIMGEYFFTNVMREHDRVSVWVTENIIWPYYDAPGLPVALAMARWSNHTDVMQFLSDRRLWPINGTYGEVERATREVENNFTGRLFGAAYIISAGGMHTGKVKYSSKWRYVMLGCVGGLVELLPSRRWRSIQEATTAIASLYGWGGFMAYEVACDLRWARGWLDLAPDIYTWGHAGPGAIRGLSYLGMKRNPLGDMRHLLSAAYARDWEVEWDRRLEMRDIEHSLCEYGKYYRALQGITPKRRYRPLVAR